MLNNNDFQELVEDLSTADVSILVATLKTLCQSPTQDNRVIPYLKTLLNNTTPCVVMLPYHFGEIRWLAAKALAAEYNAIGFKESINLDHAVIPVNTEELVSIASVEGIKLKGGIEGVLETFTILQSMKKLPLYALVISPKTVALINPV